MRSQESLVLVFVLMGQSTALAMVAHVTSALETGFVGFTNGPLSVMGVAT
jgi:hypothetical protein